MRRLPPFLLKSCWITVLYSTALFACGGSEPALPAFDVTDGPRAFAGVSVIPMDGPGILEAQTVLIRDGRIAAVGPAASTPIPEDAAVVDGTGLFIMPGLAEMHAHLPDSTDGPDVDELLFLWAANGVTTLRSMQGSPSHVTLSDQLSDGRRFGPHLYTASPPMSGDVIADPATAEARVREYARTGYDLVKTYPGLSRESWDRIIETAQDVGLPVGGHVPVDVGLEHALASGVSTIDHFDGFLEFLLGPGYNDQLLQGRQPPADSLVLATSQERIEELAQRVADTDTWLVPTLQLWEYFFNAANPDSLIAQPEMRYVSPLQRQSWYSMRNYRGDRPPGVGEAVIDGRLRLLKALDDQGARLLFGTDSPQMLNVPGFSTHREIDLMESSGMDPWRILVTATRNVGAYARDDLAEDVPFGVVAVGARADLIAVRGNPLEDLDRLQDLAGVMIQGRWLSGDEIARVLEELEERYRGESPPRE